MTGDSIACEGKKAFPTYWKAQREATKLNRRNDGAKANAYKCAGTHHFHVGNTLKGNLYRKLKKSNNVTIHGYDRKKR